MTISKKAVRVAAWLAGAAFLLGCLIAYILIYDGFRGVMTVAIIFDLLLSHHYTPLVAILFLAFAVSFRMAYSRIKDAPVRTLLANGMKRFLKFSMAVIFVLVAGFIGGVQMYRGIAFYMSPPPDCYESGTSRQVISPDGKWVAEDRNEVCGWVVPPETSFLLIHKVGEKEDLSMSARIFSFDNDYLSDIRWNGSNELIVQLPLVRRPCGVNYISIPYEKDVPLSALPTDFRGIHLKYVP